MKNIKLKTEELNRISIDEFKKSKKTNLVVILDNIRSIYNVGSVFRTSDAFKIEKICLCGITNTPPSADLHKTALGAENSIEWEYYKDTCEAIKELQNKNYKVYAIEQAKGSTMLENINIEKEGKYAIVFGHEVKGVQQKVIDACDMCIEIPQYGTKHSLNISVTAGIVIWTLFEKLNF